MEKLTKKLGMLCLDKFLRVKALRNSPSSEALEEDEKFPIRRKPVRSLKKLSLILILLTFCLSASAAIVTFQSGDGVGETVDVPYLAIVGAPTFNVVSHPVWAVLPPAAWISWTETGQTGGALSPPNSPGIGSPTAIFYESFVLPYSVNAGSATFGADDTMAVYLYNALNPAGVLLKAANWVQDSACAAGPIACEVGELETIILTGFLSQGVNTLVMEAFQRGGGPFAVIEKGEIESRVPEPATFAVMGLGLLGLLLAKRRCHR